jgi:hypothetical protein
MRSGVAAKRHVASLLVAALVVVAAAAPAWSAKWVRGCPKEKQKHYRIGPASTLAYTTSPYVHVGHDLTLRLSKMPRRGGFSIEPDGNTVEITFPPFGGDPIPLPPFTVTATSETSMPFRHRTHGRCSAGSSSVRSRWW